jgi:hypothetical protein
MMTARGLMMAVAFIEINLSTESKKEGIQSTLVDAEHDDCPS